MLLEFMKGEDVRFLGLLDLQKTLQRALRRSNLPLAYSNGYNPHLITSFASAPSTGTTSEAEIIDIALVKDVDGAQALSQMNAVLPPALQARRIVLVGDKAPAPMSLLREASYTITLQGDSVAKITACIADFLAQTEIMATRKTKRGEALVDIRPMIHELQVEKEGASEALLRVRVSFEEKATCKPDLLLRALCDYCKADMPYARFHRTGLFTTREGQPMPLMEYYANV